MTNEPKAPDEAPTDMHGYSIFGYDDYPDKNPPSRARRPKMAKPAENLRGLAMSPHTTMDEAAMLKNCGRLLDEAEQALAAYKAAWDSLFQQCLSSGVTNAWGVPVDLTLVNEAQRGEATLAKLRGEQ